MVTVLDPGYEDLPDAEFDLAEDELDDDSNHNFHSQHPDTTWENRLKQAGETIRNQKQFTTQSQVAEFLHQFGDVTRQCNVQAGNILHVLVEVVQHNRLIPEDVELLARALVKQAPDLVAVSNKDKKTPILMAIRFCQDRLLEYMISSCVEHEDQPNALVCLNAALSLPHDGTETALHAAFGEKLNWKSLKLLMEHATNETISIGDNLQKTPMHHAVQFKRCNQQRVELIELLIQKDSLERVNKTKSAKTFLDMCDKDGVSVFQEHENTRKSWEIMIRAKSLLKAESDPADSPRTGERLPPRDPRLPTRTREQPKPQATLKIPGDRDRESSGRKGQSLTATQEKELLRQKMKDEEQARLQKDDLSVKDYQPIDNDESDRRASSPYRQSRTADKEEPLHVRIFDPVRPTETAPNTGIRRTNTGRVKVEDPDNGSSAAKQVASTEKTRKHLNNSNKILQKLKLYYMRTRNPEMVMFFLYGNNTNDIQTGFDYTGSPSDISWKDFKRRFGTDLSRGYKFDPVLQYATFPYVKVYDKLTPAEKEAAGKESAKAPVGRKDIKYFLDWLYAKGVRHIIKLSVEEPMDVGRGVHGDQTIQEALEKFVVEHLDWKKTDLDPETILHIGSQREKPSAEGPGDNDPVMESQMRKLTLVWSGSNAVLRAWSDEDALPKMRFLQEVEIVRPPPHMICDSKEWINKKISDFESRLNKSREALLSEQATREVSFEGSPLGYIRVNLVDPTTGVQEGVTPHGVLPTTSLAPEKGINAHQWLSSVEEFASVMKPFWDSTAKRFTEMNQNMATAEGVEKPVTIALIDDGVNKFEIDHPNQVLEGKSFDFHDERVNSPFLSAKGHGTTMARMILRVCPMAEIYPIRLKTYSDPNGNFTINADYAARAIQAALDKQADIISMSWTLPMASRTNEDPLKTNLHKVLQKAIGRNVLMFCSAPDKGKFTGSDYPSAPFPKKFFRIGAANSDGTVFNWTPDDITFILPGVHVNQDAIRSKSTQDKGMIEHTGSSVATALGAGLSAMILYCLKASILRIKIANRNQNVIPAIPTERLKDIMKRDAMKGAFESLGSQTSNKFIQVWEELDKVTIILKKWERVGPESEASMEFMKNFIDFGIKLASSVK
ncbi:intracellular serine protease [Fusarium bulbicola]|nr:intracellular serine protease [Fusarium bulbicola]